jgi:hypothetical protein
MRSDSGSETTSEDHAAQSGDVRPVELHSVLSCPVCYENVGVTTLRCGHDLCVRCLKRWSRNCPTCRCNDHIEFVDEDFVDSYDENVRKFRALPNEYKCTLGVFACSSDTGFVVMRCAARS